MGTEATSPMLPTSVRTISVATSWVVTTSPRLRPETLKINMSGSDAPASRWTVWVCPTAATTGPASSPAASNSGSPSPVRS